jgi:POT family proton-dependent oligopeptide transporter
MASILMGVAFLSPFIGHVLAGWIGSYFDQMHPSVFWAMDSAIALAGALLILLFRKRLQAALESDLAS